MIVDCHTHWGIVWQQRYPDDPAEWLRVLDRHGIDRALIYPHLGIVRLDACAADNDTVARAAARSGGRLLPVVSGWPQAGRECVAEIRRGIETLGAVGVKLHPWLQGFSLADPAVGDICAVAAEHGVPVFLHDGTPCYCLSEQVGALAARFPSTTIVLGHSGVLWNWRSAIEAARHENVWLCLCGPHMRAIETICGRVDAGRLVWGSDFGFGEADTVDYRLSILLRSKVPGALQAQILGENPLRLIGRLRCLADRTMLDRR